jgi:aryl-phospho-beta-D-glucosidase BglC (GH1 family)
MESRPCAVGGLEQMPVEIGAAFLRKNGFNAVRVPLAVSALLDKSPDAGCLPAPLAGSVSDDDLPAAEASILAAPGVTFVQSGNDGATRGYKTNNPTFVQLGYLRLLERFVTTLGDHGLLVMLDLHASKAGVWPDDGKEYFPGNLRLAWQTLTRRFCDPVRYWNVFAADLRNEPQ